MGKSYAGYNLLRHCGTVWFMCKAIEALKLDLPAAHAVALENAVRYILAKIKQPSWVEGPLPTLCLTSKDVIKLGGVGLALLTMRQYVALMKRRGSDSVERLFPKDYVAYCACLENYILAQMTALDFLHKRSFSTGAVYPFRSDYYTGEALFALMQSPRVLPSVRSVMESLLDRGYGLREQSHWMAYAACAALDTGYCGQVKVASYLNHLVDSIVRHSGYGNRFQSTPIACRSEALLVFMATAHTVGSAQSCFTWETIEAARTCAMTNLGLQLEHYARGQFKNGRASDKVQIDYIQHNGASFLGWATRGEQ